MFFSILIAGFTFNYYFFNGSNDNVTIGLYVHNYANDKKLIHPSPYIAIIENRYSV